MQTRFLKSYLGCLLGLLVGVGVKADDSSWADFAAKLLEAKDSEKAALVEKLDPVLWDAWRKDRLGNWEIWGQSLNFDEGAKAQILTPSIMNWIDMQLHVPTLRQEVFPDGVERGIAHAGVEHTYGYLFSTLVTPFGFKRARWVQGEFESGLGLLEGTFGPHAPKGTLLSNVTAFFGRIAFKGEPESQALLPALPEIIPASLFNRLNRTRLSETAKLADGTTVVLRTDLVKFPETNSKGTNTGFLVYSIKDSREKHGQLITAFPIQDGFWGQVLNPKNLGTGKVVATRYNGYVKGLSDSKFPILGERTVSK